MKTLLLLKKKKEKKKKSCHSRFVLKADKPKNMTTMQRGKCSAWTEEFFVNVKLQRWDVSDQTGS